LQESKRVRKFSREFRPGGPTDQPLNAPLIREHSCKIPVKFEKKKSRGKLFLFYTVLH
jgi:hypothetical protein